MPTIQLKKDDCVGWVHQRGEILKFKGTVMAFSISLLRKRHVHTALFSLLNESQWKMFYVLAGLGRQALSTNTHWEMRCKCYCMLWDARRRPVFKLRITPFLYPCCLHSYQQIVRLCTAKRKSKNERHLLQPPKRAPDTAWPEAPSNVAQNVSCLH